MAAILPRLGGFVKYIIATKNPKPQHIFAIADALDVEARYLVFGHTDRVAPSLMALRLSETGRFRIRRNRGTTAAD